MGSLSAELKTHVNSSRSRSDDEAVPTSTARHFKSERRRERHVAAVSRRRLRRTALAASMGRWVLLTILAAATHPPVAALHVTPARTMAAARRLLKADRCTLFLLDQASNELYSHIIDHDDAETKQEDNWDNGGLSVSQLEQNDDEPSTKDSNASRDDRRSSSASSSTRKGSTWSALSVRSPASSRPSRAARKSAWTAFSLACPARRAHRSQRSARRRR